MITGTRLLIGGLAAVALVFALALGVVLADGDGMMNGDQHGMMGDQHGMMGGQHGMMGGMMAGDTQDWGEMQERMRAYMGDEAYEQMLELVGDHAAMHAAMHPDGETAPNMPMGPGHMPGRMH
jgi:hypothetical protein